MRVLWIKSDFPLPADTGGKIRTLNLLKELARRCQITFLSFAPPDLDSSHLEQLRACGITVEPISRAEENKRSLAFPFRVLSRLGSNRPYIVNKYITDEMKTKLSELASAAKHDIAICDFLEMAWCAEYITEIPRVLFEHNVETMIWRRYHKVEKNPLKRLYFGYEKKRMERFEREACARCDHVLTVSHNDGEILKNEFGLSDYTEIPTGVDIDFFQPQEGKIDKRLVFCGSMDWMPNIDAFWWFYRDIYPQIKSHLPKVSFTVVGRRPASEIVAIGQQDKSVEITGTVPDVRPHVAAGQLYIVPLRVGGGTRIKIYEAMAMNRCVLSTSIGAEGLPLTDGENIVIADSAGEFAEKAKELLRDEDKRRRIAAAGFKMVTEKYSWRSAADRLEAVLQRVGKLRDRTQDTGTKV